MRSIALLLLSMACAPKSPRIPGPLSGLRNGPVPVAELFEEEDEDEDAPAPTARRARSSAFGAQVARAAEHYLEHRPPKQFRDDCSGFVMAVFDRVGAPIEGSTRMFFEQAQAEGVVHHKRSPALGDLAFFDDTYDRNDNGALDDDLSHVAVVIDVDQDGTITLAHAGTSRGRVTLQMNLRRADEHEDEEGNVLNDWLRRRDDDDPPQARYLSGELWRAFASFDSRSLADAE